MSQTVRKGRQNRHEKITQVLLSGKSVSPDEIRSNLVSQICGTVRWRETMDELHRLGVNELVEIGSGKVLTGLAKKTPHNFKVTNISTVAEMEQFVSDI